MNPVLKVDGLRSQLIDCDMYTWRKVEYATSPIISTAKLPCHSVGPLPTGEFPLSSPLLDVLLM